MSSGWRCSANPYPVLPENPLRINEQRCRPRQITLPSVRSGNADRAEFQKCNHPTPVWWMHHRWFRCVHRSGRVRSPVVMVIEVLTNDAPEMAVIHNDYMIETVAAQSSDESLNEWILLGIGSYKSYIFKYPSPITPRTATYLASRISCCCVTDREKT